MSEDKKQLEEQLKERFKHLDEQGKPALEKEQAIRKSYHHSLVEEVKTDRANVEASAAEERKAARLDPLELIRQLEQMRKEGFSDDIIRAAFAEVMERQTGNYRRPLKRILRSEGMIEIPAQADINKMYEDRYKGIDNETTSESVKLILDAIENSAKMRANPVRPPIRIRVASYLVRKVLAVMIMFCKVLGVK